jgi:hypothetical protein
VRSLQKNRFKVKMFARLVGLTNWLARLPNKLTPPPFRLMQIGSAFWQSRALYVAATLGVADEIGEGVKGCDEIAEALSLHEDHLYRLLRMLSSMGVFEEMTPRVFRNNRLSDCLRSDHPQSVRDMVLLHNSEVMARPWYESLEASIRSGETPFVKTHGEELFAYMDEHAGFDALFARAMDAVESLTGLDYLHDFDWSRFERVIDVGGSKGAKALAILRAYPHLEALVFDRPQVIAAAEAFWRQQGEAELLPRVDFASGDATKEIPAARSDRDIFLCMALFHALGNEDARRVLANIRRAIGSSGATLLIVETVVDEVGIDPNVAAFDMQMLIGTRGRERTLSEWQTLLEDGGFSIREVVVVRTFARFIVATVA